MPKIGFVFPSNQLAFWLVVGGTVLSAVALSSIFLERRRRNRLALFVEAHLAPRLLGGYDVSVRRPLFWLPVLGFFFLTLTFFQPHWGHAWQEVQQSSRDVLILLDTSESMNAENPLPNRLERAKQEILSLVARARGDRFGLVAFSGAAALQSPLTHDHGYFQAVLNAVDTNTVSREGTDIAAALREARKLFEEEERKGGSYNPRGRAVLLISDGEQVSGDAIEEAEKLGEYAPIFVIGVGNPDGTVIRMPESMKVYTRQPARDDTHVSRLDEDTLMRIASAGNAIRGAYARSQADNWDID